MTLRWKILLCAGANLLLTAVALLIFIRVQFQTGLESILLSPALGRLQELGEEISDELEEAAEPQWNQLLERREAFHDVRLGLFLNERGYLAGSIRDVPDAVKKHLRPPGRPAPPPPDGRPQGRRHPVFFEMDGSPRHYWFGVRIGVWRPAEDRPVPGTLLIRTDSFLLHPMLFHASPWLFWGLVFLAITLLCWIPFIRGLTSSIHKLTAAAGQIAEGNFQVQITTRRTDEIADLGHALTRMATQLNGFVHGQKRFLGDIAHELSAPISRTQAAVSILEERAEAPMQKYVAMLREEVDHISTLVNELLHFSKSSLTAKQEPATCMTIGEIVNEVLAREGATGSVVLLEGADLRIKAQRQGMVRALANVVRNAVTYAGADGPIEITARREHDDVTLVIADCGPGLPEDALDRVFQPFFRLDDSRSRASGGVGLGLAIVKAAVEASGGSVHCRNRSPKGLEVVLKLKSGVDCD
jgi:two-component system sensor histidine kinase CpxA